MRAIPSPTESTERTSETWASVPKLAIWSLMTFEISAARISISSAFPDGGLPPSAFHCLCETIESGTDGGIDLPAADADNQPAEHFGIDRRLDLHIAAFAHFQL